MHFSISIFSTDETISPVELAPMVEERALESLLFPEHTHIPVSRLTPYPVGGDLPREYHRLYDPFVASMAAAAVTERLLVGTAVCLVAQRDPIITAKQVASVDLLSGGRFLFGVGAGWNIEEAEGHGTDPSTRFGLMRERIEAMRALWTEDEAEYHGKHVNIPPSFLWPKPAQTPHPPILVGGYGRGVIDRVLAYGDEWFPIRIGDEEKLIARIEALKARAEEAGRGTIPVSLMVAPTDPSEIERYEKAGVHRCVYYLPPAGRDKVEPALDRVAELARAYSG